MSAEIFLRRLTDSNPSSQPISSTRAVSRRSDSSPSVVAFYDRRRVNSEYAPSPHTDSYLGSANQLGHGLLEGEVVRLLIPLQPADFGDEGVVLTQLRLQVLRQCRPPLE